MLYSPIKGSAISISDPDNIICNANAAGNLSGAALARTRGNSTCTEHLTSPDMTVILNTNHISLDDTKAKRLILTLNTRITSILYISLKT